MEKQGVSPHDQFTVLSQINQLLLSLEGQQQKDMKALHEAITTNYPNAELWYDDGIDASGKVVTHPTIGYGLQTIRYANGKTKPFFQYGISANMSGISVYVMGIPDKKLLPDTVSQEIGKATVSGYCIKFKKLADINISTLFKAINLGCSYTNN